MKIVVVLAVIAVVAVLFFGFSQMTGFSITQQTDAKPTDSMGTVELSPDENPSTPERDITIRVIQGDFNPRHVTVEKGEKVTITLVGETIAEGFDVHGFSIKEFGVDEEVVVGETSTFSFTPDMEGSFVYYCSVFCGDGHVGQSGTLRVI